MPAIIERFLMHLQTNSGANNTIKGYKSTLKIADEFRPLETWNEDIFNLYIASLSGYKQSTRELFKMQLKRFFKWAGKDDMVKNIHVKIVGSELRREDLPTIEDVNKLIAVSGDMYKALWAFMHESGGRLNEILAIPMKNVIETDKGLRIDLPSTKTGNKTRKIICIYSSSYIRNYLAKVPKKPDDRLFPVSDSAVQDMLKKTAKIADIRHPDGTPKRLTPHLFRHAQATEMVVKGYQEALIRKKLGWSPTSTMIARYQQLVDEDVINATLDIEGVKANGIKHTPTKTLVPAEPVQVADAAMIITKLQEENNILLDKIKEQDQRISKLEKIGEDLLNMKTNGELKITHQKGLDHLEEEGKN